MRKLLVLLVILLAITIRLYNLDRVPPSLFGDEVDVGYQAYSLLTTGKDLRGNTLPFYLRSLYEYRAPAYIYSTVPFIALFGLNEWGVRIPSVFWGIISIIGLFLLVKTLFNFRLALIATLLLTISPWHIQYSRGSFEVTMLLSLLIFGSYFFLNGLQNRFYLFLSGIFFGLTFYTYSTAVIFTPLLLLILFSLNRERLLQSKDIIAIFLVTVFIVLIPWLVSVYRGESKSRFEGVSIFQDSVLLDKINLSRKSQQFLTSEGEVITNNPAIESLFHNKLTVYTQVFALNFLRSFSLDFLFGVGDPNFRHSIHEMGLLYSFELILIILGVWSVVQRVGKEKLYILGWLLIAPIPASLTSDGGYHATRLFLMIPPLVILSSLGVDYLLSHRSNKHLKFLSTLILTLMILNISFYTHRYFIHYPVESWRWWQAGFKVAMLYMRDNERGYKKIIFNDTYEPSLIRFLFWWGYPASKAQQQLKEDIKRESVLENFQGMVLDNRYYFGTVDKDKSIDTFITPEMLYLVSQQDEVAGDWDWSKDPPKNITVLKTIYNPLGKPIFYIVSGKN